MALSMLDQKKILDKTGFKYTSNKFGKFVWSVRDKRKADYDPYNGTWKIFGEGKKPPGEGSIYDFIEWMNGDG